MHRIYSQVQDYSQSNFLQHSKLSGIRTSGILIQLTKISCKTDHFYKIIKKQMCNAHMFIHHVAVLPATMPPIVLPHTGGITVEVS
jgi:hypothetical protein